MTEREYVEQIRGVAQGYLAVIGNPRRTGPDMLRIIDWRTIKQNLSPHTAIAMCDAWLENHDAEAALADFNANGGISLDELKKVLEK